MAIANIKVKLTPDGSAIDAELSKIAKKTPSIVNPELKKQAQQTIDISKDVAKEQQRLNDLKVKQAQQANAQILKDEERVSKERQRILREDIIARQKAEQQAQKIKADAEKFLQKLREQEAKDKALNQKRLDALKQFEADRLRITKTASKDLEAEVQRNVLAIQRARILGDTEEIKRLHAQNALIRSEMIKRPDVQKQGAGVGAGILGTGRQVIGGLGALKTGVFGILASEATHAFNVIRAKAKEADDAADAMSAAYRRAGVSIADLPVTLAEAGQTARELSDDFAVPTDRVKSLQAVVAGYGGQVGAVNKQIVELALANEQALQVPAEQLAKMFAKVSDPENTASLSRLGLTFRKGASDTEKWNAVLEHYGKAVGQAKLDTHDAIGNIQREINKADDNYKDFATTLNDLVSPAVSFLGKTLNSFMEDVKNFGKAPEELQGDFIRKFSKAGMTKQEVHDLIIKTLPSENVDPARIADLEKRFWTEVENKNTEERNKVLDKSIQDNTAKEVKKILNGRKLTAEQVEAELKKNHWFVDENVRKGIRAALDPDSESKPSTGAPKASYASESAELQKHLDFMLMLAGDDLQKQIALYDDYYKDLLNLSIKYYKKDEALSVQAAQEKRNRIISIVQPRSESEQQKGTLALPQKSTATTQPELPFWLQTEDSDLESIKGYLSSVTDAFENYLFTPLNQMLSGLGGLFGTLFNAIFQQIEQVAAKLLSSGIINAILNLFGGGIAGGFLGGIGNFLAGLFGGGKAGGGTLQKGKFYITGEHAPEIIDYTSGQPNVIPLSSGGQYELASRFRHVGGQNRQSLRIGGFIGVHDNGGSNFTSGGAFANPFLNVGGQDPQSLRIGGFIGIIMKQQADFMSDVGAMVRRVNTPRIIPMPIDSHGMSLSQGRSVGQMSVSYGD